MKLLAISGGPDSMHLLNQWKKNKNIIVCHVNYNKRNDSHIDQDIVESFCKKNNIKLYILNINEKPSGNFQNWARNKRYMFFKEIYDQNHCKRILFAHHKDDFIETGIMQMNSNRTPNYFGIKEKNVIMGMNIYRPYISLFWKKDILKNLKKNNINYAIDSSNNEPIFERNKIRIELKEKSREEKESLFKWFMMSNKILKKKFSKVDAYFKKWEQNNFLLSDLKYIKYKSEIIYKFIYLHVVDAKLSSKKIYSIISFLESNNYDKEFILNKKYKISKKTKCAKIIEI